MANARLSTEKQVMILAALSEGMAINATCRMFSVGKNAVLRIIEETGEAMAVYMRTNFRALTCKRLAFDEAWQYVGKHGQRMDGKEEGKGDFWLWAAMDPDSKFVPSWHVGSRNGRDCERFVFDVAGRVTGETQITTDQLNSYPVTIRMAFGNRATHATEVKEFEEVWKDGQIPKKKNGIPKIARATRKKVTGNPDLGTATTAHVERLWLTVRQELRRFQRLTLGYSKLLTMHKAAIAMHLAIYNLCRKHTSLDGATPAMAAGMEYIRWTLEDVVRETARYHKAKEDAAFERAFLKAGL